MLVLPVEFTDAKASTLGYNIDSIKKAFLPKSKTSAELDYYSVYDYFYKSSYQQLTLDITVYESWIPMSKASTYYDSQEDSEGYFIGDQVVLDEALQYLDNKGVDLSQYDSDDDSVIDAVVLINTLEIDASTDFYWAYQYFNYYVDDSGYYYEYDGVSANTFLWASYLFMHEDSIKGNYDLTNPITTYTYIHEFSHVLGADDYYNYSDNGTHPLDGFDMMDSALSDHNPFTKMHYGWINSSKLITTDSTTTIDLNAFEDNKDTIIIANDFDESKGIYQDFFIVVYYNATGLNKSPHGLFDPGVVVYHINSEIEYDGSYYYYFKNSNTDASHEYGSVDNLIEFVANGSKIIYTKDDVLSSTVKDDSNKKIPYTFKVDSMDNSKVTLTFTKNN